jgi:hydroxyacylglutathione hydrolase
MRPQQVADNVWLLTGTPRYYVNCYLAGDVLVDTGTRWARSRLLRQLESRPIHAVVLTHAHPDHQANARVLCERFGATLACHEADVDAVEGRVPMQPDNWLLRLGVRLMGGPPCPVQRVLREGDDVAGFRVIHAPGHTQGHIILYRDADRVAIAGDVFANIRVLSGRTGLVEPPKPFSVDRALNRRSMQLLAELQPALVCFGHGPPLREPAQLDAFVARLALGQRAS